MGQLVPMPEQPHYILKVVGSNVLYFRRRLDISQEELGYRANLDRTYIGGIERAERLPSVVAIYDIAKGLSIQPFELMIENREAIDLWESKFG
jgi:transcriptional regulator with XRE-family HTH domain